MKLPEKQQYAVLAILLSIALLVETQWLHLLQPLENRLFDALMAQHARSSVPDQDIVIVDIDERSLAKMADSVGRWPWPRSLHAELVEGIERQQPKAIVFDVLFSDPDMTRPTEDAYFAEVVRSYSNLYFPMLLLADAGNGTPLAQYACQLGITTRNQGNPDAHAGFILPLPAMLESRRIGTHNAVADMDGVVRRYPVYTDVQGWHIPSLPAKVAEGLGYAVPHKPELLLNWHGTALSYLRISYADVYEDMQRKSPQRPADEFRNKVVIIGATANGLHDIRATPVAGLYPGVEILATAIDNLKNRDSLHILATRHTTAIGLLLITALAWLFRRYRHPVYIAFAMAGISILAVSAQYSALSWNWSFSVLTPLAFAWIYSLSASFLEYVHERRSRERAITTFSRFLDPRVVQELIQRGQTNATMSGQSREISVLFSDIRGFTTLSENSPPEQVVELLNAYFGTQVEAIFSQEGTLDKYIGDAIMAFWGAPTEQPDHALKAVAAALDMGERLEQFRQDYSTLARHLEIGIGVHSGPAVVGFIGSAHRQDYTAIGDTVNLTSRIEGVTKGIARILVSEETRQLCEQQSGENACPFEFIDCGSHEVKGRIQAVRLYEPRKKII